MRAPRPRATRGAPPSVCALGLRLRLRPRAGIQLEGQQRSCSLLVPLSLFAHPLRHTLPCRLPATSPTQPALLALGTPPARPSSCPTPTSAGPTPRWLREWRACVASPSTWTCSWTSVRGWAPGAPAPAASCHSPAGTCSSFQPSAGGHRWTVRKRSRHALRGPTSIGGLVLARGRSDGFDTIACALQVYVLHVGHPARPSSSWGTRAL